MGAPRPNAGPPSPDRRKVLIALGFGALNAAALSQLPGKPGAARREAVATASPVLASPVAAPALPGAEDEPPATHVYGTVIAGGRVIDPDSGFDQIAHVGIDGDRVTAVSTEPLDGTTVVDATGLVVAPGFIDILSYEPNSYGIWYKIADGVTTNLGMHGINATAADFFARFAAEGSPCHYGGAYDNPFMRAALFDLGSGESASSSQIARLAEDLRAQLDAGWIGVDFEPEYTPGITSEEILALARVAAEAGVPCFFHGRYSDDTPPGTNADTLEEILTVARTTGAAVHVEHITSTGGTFTMDASLATLEAARAEGIDVTACMYPYTFWATFLGSTRFADGWQERFRISYDDLVVAGTGERLTEATFRRHQQDNALVAAFAIPEEDVLAALASPFVMIGSDAILEPDNRNHPRATGCFTRVLGHYVRDERAIDLLPALAKMTILPARRLEGGAPAMARKGRLQRGADADVVVFDPATVRDTSTLQDPASYAEGMRHVFVAGQQVLSPAGIDESVKPGRPITRA